MAAFQFPDPAVQTTVTNPITGSTYQWKEPPGKWVVTVKMRDVGDIIWEGENPPNPIGDYKLWYSTDTLELYFHFCDINDVCAWVPTSAPITMLEDLDRNLASVQLDLAQTNAAVNENTNRIESIVYFGEEAPTIYADEDLGETDPVTGDPVLEQNDLNYKFWLNTATNELSILRKDDDAPVGYVYSPVSGEGGANIFYGDSPPTADDGEYELWYHTDDLELLVYIGGMWFPCTPNARVNNSPPLQEVLKAGPIATIPIVLTDGEEAFIDVDPRENRLLIAGTDNGDAATSKPPRISLVHLSGPEGQGRADIELDEGGKRLDFEMFSGVDNIHFRFEEDEKFIINKDGDAEFVGRVKVDPGREGHEVVTFQQLAEVEQSIDDLQPSIDHGDWLYQTEKSNTTDPGTFSLFNYPGTSEYCNLVYADCLLAANNETERLECGTDLTACLDEDIVAKTDVPWKHAGYISINKVDTKGNNHSFSSDEIHVGDMIEIMNIDGDGYAVYEITAEASSGVLAEVWLIKHKHSHGNPSGEASIKFFKLFNPGNYYTKDQADDQFINKTGDTMSGPLTVSGRTADSSPSLLLYPTDSAGDNSDALKVYNKDGESQFYVTIGGDVAAGEDWSPTKDIHLTTKGYVDDNLVSKAGDMMTGKLRIYPETKEQSLVIQTAYDFTESEDIFTVQATGRGEDAFWVNNNLDVGVSYMWPGPTEDNHIATKKYVDTFPVGPARNSYQFKKTTDTPYEFQMCSPSQAPSAGMEFVLSYRPKSGPKMYHKRTDSVYFESGGSVGQLMMTVWDKIDSGFRTKWTASIQKIEQDERGDFKITIGDYIAAANNITEFAEVWVSIAGFF